jgi:drug/metabolite transporter (DMT)-like permease
MNLVRIIDFLRDRLKTVVKVCAVLLGALVLIDAIPLFVDKHHAHTSIEKLPGFWALYGFLGCVLIILGSKAFGKAGIMKREDYYDE